jgi:hypothetical protein
LIITIAIACVFILIYNIWAIVGLLLIAVLSLSILRMLDI